MTDKRRTGIDHIWRKSANPRIRPWCERCGIDMPKNPENDPTYRNCRPTRIVSL